LLRGEGESNHASDLQGHHRLGCAAQLTALGSAREVEAVCDLGEALGYVTLNAETRAMLNHVIGALVLLTR